MGQFAEPVPSWRRNAEPATRMPRLQQRRAGHPAASGQGNDPPVRVVIVDAHVRLLRTMARVLASCPFIDVIATASSAADGARVVRKFRPDVVLTDYRLPDVAGLEAIR